VANGRWYVARLTDTLLDDVKIDPLDGEHFYPTAMLHAHGQILVVGYFPRVDHSWGIRQWHPKAGESTALSGVSERGGISHFTDVVYDGKWIWILSAGNNQILGFGADGVIDPEDPAFVIDLPHGEYPSSITFDGRDLWVTFKDSNEVARIDPLTGGVLTTVRAGTKPVAILFDGHYIWIANARSGDLTRIDPAYPRNPLTFKLPKHSEPAGLEFDGVYLWILDTANDRVLRIEPKNPGKVEHFKTGPKPIDILFDADVLWILHKGGDVTALNVDTGARVASFDVVDDAALMAFDGYAVWVSTRDAALHRQ
jgi:hypothetical protein